MSKPESNRPPPSRPDLGGLIEQTAQLRADIADMIRAQSEGLGLRRAPFGLFTAGDGEERR